MSIATTPIRTLAPRAQAYRRLLTVGPMVDMAYRFRAYMAAFNLITRIYLFYALWTAVYQPGQVLAGISVHQAVTYSVLAALQGWAGRASADDLSSRVRDGSIVYLFLRPFPVLRYFLVQRVGSSVYGLAWMAGGAIIAYVTGLITPPASLAALGVFLVSTLLAEAVNFYLYFLLQLTAFWTLQITGISMLYSFIVQLLAGALVPIWFFPGPLQRLSSWLPFQAAASTPLSLYIGRLPLSGAVGDLLLQAFWIAVLAGVARLIWARAERRVVVQGG